MGIWAIFNYGIVKDADLYLGENFKYRAVFGGFQSIQEHVKEFYSRFAGSTENQKDILASYGFKEDGNLDTVIRITAASRVRPAKMENIRTIRRIGPAFSIKALFRIFLRNRFPA